MSCSWYASVGRAARAAPSSWPVHFRNPGCTPWRLALRGPDRGSLLSAGSDLRGSLLRCLDFGVIRLSAVGCAVLLAATLSIAQDSKSETQQPASHSKAATSS